MAARWDPQEDRAPKLSLATELPMAASHRFSRRLNQLLREHGFDDFVEALAPR